ncbi:uncharacterized protein N7469_009599 [Penicillium citrinum]|uniref:Protein ROT1 n=2 Tax=Penicillium TaxID=5073 RepID=A0A9W9TFA2_PENCI|nr:uncharacterized protein N7469_009599 [Penicillium citrinum]KAJ5220712.1 hypothetical protein N7469_009599 [Penicillium citrinum]KAJ5595723.1 hypothetical protein N7450_002181 [Penicillium hetheringtonii]
MIFLWALLGIAAATNVEDLVGTWTTKSKQVITGPGFYDPINDKFFEPNLTGISYSFDGKGHYEEAFYRAIANPTDPSCPSGILQFQHGSYSVSADGSMVLHPIASDGRQLLSEPCKQSTASYTRYNNTELFKSFSVYVDPYHDILRLDLTQSTGTIMHPMFLAYRPPKMLPTNTLNPVPTDSKKKRDLSGSDLHLVIKEELINPDRWWWFGVLATSLGGAAFFFS